MDKENKYEAVAETSVLYGNNRALAALAFYHGMYAMAAAEAEGLKVKARIQAPAGTEKSYVSWLKQDLREKSKKEGIRKADRKKEKRVKRSGRKSGCHDKMGRHGRNA